MSFLKDATLFVFPILMLAVKEINADISLHSYETNCTTLQMGQYLCPSPEIDPLTQQPKGCSQNNIATSM